MNELLAQVQSIPLSNFWKVVLSGAFGGWMTAVKVDYNAFKSFKSFNDATKYNWGVALWRWFQGAVIGGVGAAGGASLLGVQ